MNREIKFLNYSKLVKKQNNNDWWQWCIFVNDEKSVVNTIKQIEYTLHPTFPDPIRTVTDRSNRFVLYSSGWGQFTAKIEIIFNDYSTHNQKHFIIFGKDRWPIKEVPLNFDSPDEKEVYHAIKHDKHLWRKNNTIMNNTGFSAEKVIDILSILEKKDLVRKSPFQAIDKSDLWGITAIVGCSPPQL